jgi:hypothetical protein
MPYGQDPNSRYGKPESLNKSAPNELRPMTRQFKNYESANNRAETQGRHKGLVNPRNYNAREAPQLTSNPGSSKTGGRA